MSYWGKNRKTRSLAIQISKAVKMGSFSDSTAKRVHVFTESLGSFRQSFVQVSVPSLGGGDNHIHLKAHGPGNWKFGLTRIGSTLHVRSLCSKSF